jgi:hypothetical protein
VGQTDIELTQIPIFLAERLGISVFAAGLLASGVMILLPVIIISILTRGKGFIMQLVMIIIFMGLGIALTWLPVWFLIVFAFLIAGLFANQIRDIFGGH